ncbi:MAG: hypothetical protein IIW48_00160 [Clostridia bacterium]|nr:hypothetical protein [Clostridia bacterium]
MNRFKKAVSIILVLVLVLSLAACSGMKKQKFGKWYNEEFSPAYDAFVQTEYGMANAPSPNLSLMIASSAYLNYIFDYIADGTQPEKGEVKEEDGVYSYVTDTFIQKVEFNTQKATIRITNILRLFGESAIQSVTTFTERSGQYYIQHHMPDFKEYYEIRFTAESGEIKRDSTDNIPYSIFEEDIPKTFAKES